MQVGKRVAKPKRARAPHLGPERRREQVLDAALATALELGIDGLTTAAVAERLDVTKPVVYACFASRTALIDALLEREEHRLTQGVMAALAQDVFGQSPKQTVIGGFQALLKTAVSMPDAWRIVFAEEFATATAKRFRRARNAVAQRVAELMRPSLQAWGTEDVERKLPVLVELFMAASEGAVRAVVVSGDQWTVEELGAFVGRLVLSFLKAA